MEEYDRYRLADLRRKQAFWAAGLSAAAVLAVVIGLIPSAKQEWLNVWRNGTALLADSDQERSETVLKEDRLQAYLDLHDTVRSTLKRLTELEPFLEDPGTWEGRLYTNYDLRRKDVLYLTYRKEWEDGTSCKASVDVEIESGRLLAFQWLSLPGIYSSLGTIDPESPDYLQKRKEAETILRQLLGDDIRKYSPREEFMKHETQISDAFRYYIVVNGIPIMNREVSLLLSAGGHILQYYNDTPKPEELTRFPATASLPVIADRAKAIYMEEVGRNVRRYSIRAPEKNLILPNFMFQVHATNGEISSLGSLILVSNGSEHAVEGLQETLSYYERLLDRYPLFLACLWPEANDPGSPYLAYRPSFGGQTITLQDLP